MSRYSEKEEPDKEESEDCRKPGKSKKAAVFRYGGTLKSWTEEHFFSCRLLLFIGAAGIAVRAVAPFVEDKRTDPAVLAMDERGCYVIPLLSGHLGGANEAARKLAQALGAEPVITTATDVNRVFSVDLFAKKNGLHISDMELAKEVSAALLQGMAVCVTADEELEGQLAEAGLPEGLVFRRMKEVKAFSDSGRKAEEDIREFHEKKQEIQSPPWIHIGVRRRAELPADTLYLIPRAAAVGIGCRKGASCSAVRAQVKKMVEENGIFPEAVFAAATVDLKKEEAGLLAFARECGWEFRAYSAEELREVPGIFSSSQFVESVAGVDNVCERAAVLAAGEGRRKAGASAEWKNCCGNHKGIPEGEKEAGRGNASAENPGSEKTGEFREPCAGNGRTELIARKTAGNGVTAACAAGYGRIRFIWESSLQSKRKEGL